MGSDVPDTDCNGAGKKGTPGDPVTHVDGAHLGVAIGRQYTA